MTKFIELNEKKIKYIFFVSASVFLFFTGILLLWSFYQNAFPGLELTIEIILGAGVFLPIFIVALAWYDWYMKRRIRLNALKVSPFDQLEKIGFYRYYLFEHSRFHFTEEVSRAEINDFSIICDLEHKLPKKINFRIIAEAKKINSTEFDVMESEFKNLDFDFDTLTKTYNLKRTFPQRIEDLKKDLINITDILKENGFNPVNE
jgi:uncharacterized membrane protein (DUF485 family)